MLQLLSSGTHVVRHARVSWAAQVASSRIVVSTVGLACPTPSASPLECPGACGGPASSSVLSCAAAPCADAPVTSCRLHESGYGPIAKRGCGMPPRAVFAARTVCMANTPQFVPSFCLTTSTKGLCGFLAHSFGSVDIVVLVS